LLQLEGEGQDTIEKITKINVMQPHQMDLKQADQEENEKQRTLFNTKQEGCGHSNYKVDKDLKGKH